MAVMNDYKAEFEKTIHKLSGKYQTWQVWADWVFMFATALSQGLDYRENREKRYIETASRYTPEEMDVIRELCNITINALTENRDQDFLGNIYMDLNLANHWKGQFFTPYSVCRCMAELQCHTCLDKIKELGYTTISDPSCGGGATLIAAFEYIHLKMIEEKSPLNPQDHVLLVGQDISETTAQMCYIQLSLLGIAAIIKVGDTLAEPLTGDLLNLPRTNDLWFTPMYNMPTWAGRQICHYLDLMNKHNATKTKHNASKTA